MVDKTPYSYRSDSLVPGFDDAHPLMVFDGVCVLCSGGAARLMKWDKHRRFRFATAQSPLGQALLKHYGCDAVTFDTVLLIAEGRGYVRSDAFIETAHHLGGLWSILTVARFIPKPARDALYDFKARNRYRWFGKTGYCELLPDGDARFLDK